ncbi:MAG: response regulator [Myxococcota bacterium]|nr:response regulator [Myxococcota bacterium]
MSTTSYDDMGKGCPPLAPSASVPRLLIAVSGRTKQKIIENNLKTLEHTAVYSDDGNEALRLALGSPGEFDAILLQANLSGFSGFEVCKHLASNSLAKDIPVLLLSSNEELRWSARMAGARAFVKTPFYSIQLVAEIQKVLRDVPKIVLYDGNEAEACLIDEILSRRNYELIVSSGLDDLTGLLVTRRPDLLLFALFTDTEKDLEVCTRLKAADEFCELPVIVITSGEIEEIEEKIFEAGVEDYVARPIDPEVLLESTDRNLGGKGKFDRHRILVVEDSTPIRNLIMKGLVAEGNHVKAVSNGKAAMEALSDPRFELVITDYEMPEMDGFELLKNIRSQESFKFLPVLMLSAHKDPALKNRAESYGAAAFLRKPFRVDQLVVVADQIISANHSLRERELLAKYVSDATVQTVKSSGREFAGQMVAENRFMTILFCDIVGFTPMCESMAPKEVVRFLNEYFDITLSVVQRNDGMVDKIIGDAFMVLYGKIENGAYRAVKSGLEIAEAVKKFNEETGRNMAVRIGINSGPVIMGDIGSHLYRKDYTVVGDHVNIAQRLESMAPRNGVMISDATFSLLGGVVKVSSSTELEVKGKKNLLVGHVVSEIVKLSV